MERTKEGYWKLPKKEGGVQVLTDGQNTWVEDVNEAIMQTKEEGTLLMIMPARPEKV